jgi:hypothetical protein
MPSFVGVWNTTRYFSNDPANPQNIVLTISEDTDPANLDGTYPRIGMNGRLFGAIDPTTLIWTATIDEPGETGAAVFFISNDGNTIHGAWTGPNHANNIPQPWFGTRVP